MMRLGKSLMTFRVAGCEQVGSVQRPGISPKSTACGALRAFASEVESGEVDLRLDLADLEQSMLKQVTWG